jgi:hypothetical protein
MGLFYWQNFNFWTSHEWKYVDNMEYRDTDRKRFHAVFFSESTPKINIHSENSESEFQLFIYSSLKP